MQSEGHFREPRSSSLHDPTERPAGVLLQLPVNSAAHRPVAVYRRETLQVPSKKTEIPLPPVSVFPFKQAPLHTQTTQTAPPLFLHATLRPAAITLIVLHVGGRAAAKENFWSQFGRTSCLGKGKIPQKKLDPLVVFFSQNRGGRKGEKEPRPSQTNRKASPSSPVLPFHALTMVAMVAIFQFIIVSTRPGRVWSAAFLRLLHL